MKYKINDIVKIIWADAASADPWTDIDFKLTLEEVISVGIITQLPDKKDAFIVITQSVSETQKAGQLGIPFSWIKKIVVLESYKKRIK